jgi:transcriptional regulator with XRE-family HTH domain
MPQDTNEIAATLRQTRQAKGLSQRALSQRAGVPQGHISNIERGTVDLRLSSLVAIARVLDLELALVPRHSLTAIQSIVRRATAEAPAQDEAARIVLGDLIRQIENVPTVPPPFTALFDRLDLHVRGLERLRLQRSDAVTLRAAKDELAKFVNLMALPKAKAKASVSLEHAARLLTDIRDARWREAAGRPALAEPPRPAYSLDDDADADADDDA